jgi:hypothetical protein
MLRFPSAILLKKRRPFGEMLDRRSETDSGSCQAARIRFVANYPCQVATVEVRRLVNDKLLQFNVQFLKVFRARVHLARLFSIVADWSSKLNYVA